MECDGIVDEDDERVEGFYDLRRSLIKAPSYPRWCLSIARGASRDFLDALGLLTGRRPG